MSSLPNSYAHDQYGCSSDTEKFLEQYDAYIRTQARKQVFNTRRLIRPEMFDMEVDELAQKTRIKVWLACQKQQIQMPKAYINRIVHNESVSMVRQHKPVSPLPVGEDCELYQGKLLVTMGEMEGDPACEMEQEETMRELLNMVIDAICALPPIQRLAVINVMREAADDPLPFIEASQKFLPSFPREKVDRQHLRASLSIARRKLQGCLEGKHNRGAYAMQQSHRQVYLSPSYSASAS